MKKHTFRKAMTSTLLAGVLIFTFISITDIFSRQADTISADTLSSGHTAGMASITEELIAQRTKFTKKFVMSDGSFTTASYSMPVNYKKKMVSGKRSTLPL